MGILNNILLAEGARDRALEHFIPFLQQRGIQIDPRTMTTVKGGVAKDGEPIPPLSISLLKQFLLNKFVTEGEMHNLSLDSNFYLLGVARYYFNGDLTTNKQLNALYPRIKDRFIPEVCQKLDTLILILRNAYIDSVGTQWEQPEDFGTLTIQQLFKKYNRQIKKELSSVQNTAEQDQTEEQEIEAPNTVGNYTYEILYSYDDARKYFEYTKPGAWCITYGQQHYNGYIRKFKKYGGIHYIVFKQNGFENVKRKQERDKWHLGPEGLPKPQDTYGNSLICVLQRNSSPEPEFITSRWNHGEHFELEADHAYTKEEFLNVIGSNESILTRIYNEWKKNVNGEKKNKKQPVNKRELILATRKFKYAQMLINSGADPFKLDFIELKSVHQTNANDKPNPKAMYYVDATEGESVFRTIMSKKVIFFNDLVAEASTLRKQPTRPACEFFWLENSSNNMIFDKIRNRFFEIDGINVFKRFCCNSYNDPSKTSYAILAVDVKQLALVNLETMKTVKAKNGSSWFEGILTFDSTAKSNLRPYTAERVSNLNLSFTDLYGSNILRLVYDSSAGIEFYYNTKSNSFVDTTAPEGFTFPLNDWRPHPEHTPGPDYITFIGKRKTSSGRKFDVLAFKDTTNNELLTINGISEFFRIRRGYQNTPLSKIFTFVPYIKGSEETRTYYYDNEIKKVIDFEGKPITSNTPHVGDTPMGDNGFLLIPFEEGNTQKTNLISSMAYLAYIPGTGEFYHDSKNGYILPFVGRDKILDPQACEEKIKDEIPYTKSESFIMDCCTYRLPKLDEYKKMNESKEKLLSMIIRETIFNELKKLL